MSACDEWIPELLPRCAGKDGDEDADGVEDDVASKDGVNANGYEIEFPYRHKDFEI